MPHHKTEYENQMTKTGLFRYEIAGLKMQIAELHAKNAQLGVLLTKSEKFVQALRHRVGELEAELRERAR